MKAISNLLFLLCFLTSAVTIAQTPFDDFAPSTQVKPILSLTETRFRVYNPDSTNEIHYIELYKESGLLAYYDRHDSMLGEFILAEREKKWLSTDPDAKKYPSKSPYNFCSNDPINRIDPDGRGDFYSQTSQKLGSDGNEDGKIYVVIDNKVATMIRKQDAKGIRTQVVDVQASIIQLPSAYVRKEMGKAVDRSNSPTSDDKIGGFHEEGGTFGSTADGKEKVVDAKPGAYSDPSKNANAEVSVFVANNPDEQTVLKDNSGNTTYQGTFHVHPSGTVELPKDPFESLGSSQNIIVSSSSSGVPVACFVQPPSPRDITNAEKRSKSGTLPPSAYSYVLGAGDNTVYIYNASGVKAKFPLKEFRNIGNSTTPTKK